VRELCWVEIIGEDCNRTDAGKGDFNSNGSGNKFGVRDFTQVDSRN